METMKKFEAKNLAAITMKESMELTDIEQPFCNPCYH